MHPKEYDLVAIRVDTGERLHLGCFECLEQNRVIVQCMSGSLHVVPEPEV